MTDTADRVARLFDNHSGRLYRLARRLSSQPDDALDLVQETFLRAAQSLRTVPVDPAGEEAWLVRVLVNIQRDHWRKRAVRDRHARLTTIVQVTEGDEGALIARSMVWHALQYLPPRRRAIVVMHELEGLTAAAIGQLLGITAMTVRWHLSRGRRELAARLAPHSGESDERARTAIA